MSSERVLEDLYEAHSAALMSFCRHLLGSREEAKDVLQQTFVRALGALRDGIEPEHRARGCSRSPATVPCRC